VARRPSSWRRASAGLADAPTRRVRRGVFARCRIAELRRALRYPDEGENGDPPRAGDRALAAFTVADDGYLIRGSQVLSSCGWGISRAFAASGSRGWLADFERAIAAFSDAVEQLTAVEDEDRDEDDLEQLDEGIGPHVDGGLLKGDSRVRRRASPTAGREGQPDDSRCDGPACPQPTGRNGQSLPRDRTQLLNSFIARDLETVTQAVGRKASGSALARYLRAATTVEHGTGGPVGRGP
jgi:hypothetical protein